MQQRSHRAGDRTILGAAERLERAVEVAAQARLGFFGEPRRRLHVAVVNGVEDPSRKTCRADPDHQHQRQPVGEQRGERLPSRGFERRPHQPHTAWST